MFVEEREMGPVKERRRGRMWGRGKVKAGIDDESSGI
jgi:hypothetical protein